MSISELHAKADRLEKELQETRELLAREAWVGLLCFLYFIVYKKYTTH